MSMIPLGASSCAGKVISRSTEQWRIFVKTWFYLCVHFFHGEYMKVHKTAIFTLHVALCYNRTELYLYSLTCATFNRTLLVQFNRFSINRSCRLDSRLSVFVIIISSYIRTLSMGCYFLWRC